MADSQPKLTEGVSRPDDSGIVQGSEIESVSRSEESSSSGHEFGAPQMVPCSSQGTSAFVASRINSGTVVRSLSSDIHTTQDPSSPMDDEVSQQDSNELSEANMVSPASEIGGDSTTPIFVTTFQPAQANVDLRAEIAEKDATIQQLQKDFEKISLEKDEMELKLKQELEQSQHNLQLTQTELCGKDRIINDMKEKMASLEQQIRSAKDERTILGQQCIQESSNDENNDHKPSQGNASLQAPHQENPFFCQVSTTERVTVQASDDQPEQSKAEIIKLLKQLLKSRKTIDILYLKLCFVGPPSVGKTTTRDRLLKEIENIKKAGIGYRTQSTLFANCNQVLASVDGNEWLTSKTFEEEAWLLFSYLRERALNYNSTDSGHPIVGTQTSISGNKLSQAPIQETMPSQQPHSRLEAVISRLQNLISCGDYTRFKSMLGSTLLNIHDIGGQPNFLEMLPALIRGPAMYLVCFNMSEELDKPYTIEFCRSDTNTTITPYESNHSVESTISRILSSIANVRCMSSEQAPSMLQNVPGFSERFKKFKKVPPIVALVGTHKDMVNSEDYDDKFKDINDSLKGMMQAFNSKRIKFIKIPGGAFFPVDNMNGTDSADIAPLRCSLSKLFISQFKDASLPIQPNWLLLGITLRKEYCIAKMSDCLEIGKLLNMYENEVTFSIWYLHFCVGALIYYPNLADGSDTWFKDNVICSPQVIFDSISQLIITPLRTLHSGEESYFDDDRTEWIEKGLFSIDSISIYCSDTVSNDVDNFKLISIDNLVKLLEHINLLSPIALEADHEFKTMYFMPAVLECAPSKMLMSRSEPDADNPEPLFITFECGHVPTGVFCGIITRIVSRKNLGLGWKLKQKDVKQNFVSFLIHNVNVVTLLSHAKCYEIRVSRKQSSISLHDLCAHVVSVFLFVIKELYEDITPLVAFQCPCPKHESLDINKHLQLCILKRDVWLQYLCEDKEVNLRNSQKVWIGKHVTLGHSACLEVLQHTEEDFNYHWTKDGSRDPIKASGNILPFPLVKEKDLGHYQCQVKKKGGKLVLTTYRALFESTEPASHSGEIVKTLDTEIEELDLIYLARYFDCIDLFLDQLGLTGGEKDDVRGKKTTQLAMREALSLWRKRDPSKATFRQLTNITEEQRRGDIARKIEQYVSQFN